MNVILISDLLGLSLPSDMNVFKNLTKHSKTIIQIKNRVFRIASLVFNVKVEKIGTFGGEDTRHLILQLSIAAFGLARRLGL